MQLIFFLPLCSLNDSLSYNMSKMELEIDKMGLELFSKCNILMELLLPAFCAKIVFFFSIYLRRKILRFQLMYLVSISIIAVFLDVS